MSRSRARRTLVRRKGRKAGYIGYEGPEHVDAISGITWPEELMVEQCGGWVRRGYQHGTHHRKEPADDCCPAREAPAILSVAATDATAGEDGSTGTFTITRRGNTEGELRVYFGLTGTAESGTDFSLSQASPVTFADGETTKVITVTPLPDALTEGDETVVLSIVPSTCTLYTIDLAAYSATVTIADTGQEN